MSTPIPDHPLENYCEQSTELASSVLSRPEIQTQGFVVLSQFVVANGLTAKVKAAFRARPHFVDHAPGYLRMEVISPMDRPDEIWLITFWTDETSFRTWHGSHHYHDSHKGMPKGLKLIPKETQIRYFEHVAS